MGEKANVRMQEAIVLSLSLKVTNYLSFISLIRVYFWFKVYFWFSTRS